jgi:ABC-2 type transporter
VLAHSRTIAWRNLVQVVRSPELLVFSVVQPIVFVLLFNYVFGGAIQTPGVAYIDFLIPGLVAWTVACRQHQPLQPAERHDPAGSCA